MTRDKFIPELRLKQLEFTYNTCGPFTKHGEIIQKFREAGNLKHWYRNELGKACFPHDAAYSNSKSLPKRTISEKIFKRKTLWNCKKSKIWWRLKSISKYDL